MAQYLIRLALRLGREQDGVIFSRDPVLLLALALLWPRRAARMAFEAHTFPSSRVGTSIRRALARRAGLVVALTGHLAERHRALDGVGRVITAHDGVRLGRFAGMPDRASARRDLGWLEDAFIVGYLGRFVSGLEGMGKGLETLAEAALLLHREDASTRLVLVGGPALALDPVRARLEALGAPPGFLIAPGEVTPAQVPTCLRAFDVCTIPSPWNDFYAYYTSPLKLFEYMAAERAIVASDLPSTVEVIRDGDNGLLVPPDDAPALASALRRLRDDPALRARLGEQASRDVRTYTWEARARLILDQLAAQSQGG